MDGGYAEVMIAEARGIASIPDELSSAEAAPSSARVSRPTTLFATPGLRGGDLVAVHAIAFSHS